ncbi:GAF domain-containing SpoIIE family protein phosphatase [Leptospira idonii]|uniref:Serine/threonine protein phosphatase n=1 Tax=Leptospira idonii TaxID=1193500 RepID=A0A4R9M064_9LEPT|nr:GAF domain-containing SpoIIE family protein phosphatase [Leptospira idonii]TGN20040.1 serine/threonine protein phosphatase [Leptospira idonii]
MSEDSEQSVRLSRLESYIHLSEDPIWCYELDAPMPIDLPRDEQPKYLFERSIIRECNHATAVMYGCKNSNEMIGRYVKDIMPLVDLSPLQAFVSSGYFLENLEYVEHLSGNQPRHFLLTVKGQVEKGYLIRAWGQQKEITARKDSENKLNELLKLSRILNEISSSFVYCKAERIADAIHFALEKIGEYTFADKTFISEISKDREFLSVTYEWLAPGISSTMKDRQNMPIASMNQEYLRVIANDGILFFPDASDVSDNSLSKKVLEEAGVQSILIIGLRDEGTLIGMLGVVKFLEQEDWPKESHHFISLAAGLISQGMVRSRSEISLKIKEKKLQSFYSEIKEDLHLAKSTQEAWIAKDFPAFPGISFYTRFSPYGEIGGDLILYDCPNSDYIDILFGDISGHGISSALVTGIIAMSFKKYSDSLLSPLALLQAMNDELKPVVGKHHLSCCLLRIFSKTRESIFCFAGHPPAVIWNEKTNKVQGTLLGESYPLLLIDDWVGKEIKWKFQQGDRLLLFSDGIYEVEKEGEGFLGLDFFLNQLDGLIASGFTGQNFLTQVLNQTLRGNRYKIHDDIAILLIEFS